MIQIGQRWSFSGYGIVEITSISSDRKTYRARIVQVFYHGWAEGTLGMEWILPGWEDDKPFSNSWDYLEGQDNLTYV